MKKYITIISLGLIFIFALFSSLNNSNAATLNNSKWNLYFENIKITDGSVNAVEEPTITGNSNSEISFSVNLNVPGEFYEFLVDMTNAGSMDAMVDEVNGNQLSDVQKKYLTYDITYLDGTKVEKKDLLKAGTTKTIKVRIEFRNDMEIKDLPKEDTSILLSLNAVYIQADEDAKDPDDKKTDNDKKEENNESEQKQGSKQENSKIIDNENNKNTNKDSKSVKTGDMIVKYAIIGVMALTTLIFTIYKTKKENI